MKFLIVKVSALGDVVHALPVLPYLRSAVPEAQIDWLVEETFAPLLEGHPLIRRVHRLRTRAWRRQGMTRSGREIRELVRELRQERYDIALDLQGNSKSGLFTFLSGAPLRYGFGPGGVRERLNLLATNCRVPLGPEECHATDRMLAIVRRAFPGGESVPVGPLHVPPAAAGAVEDRVRALGLAGKPLVVLHHGTTWKSKMWSLEVWRALTLRLGRDGNVHVVLTWGGHDEKVAAEEIAAVAPDATTVWPRSSLPELAALLKRASLVIGGDTGPVHMAAALGTPTLSLYRGSDRRRTGTRGEGHTCIQSKMECSPCFIRGKRVCPKDELCSGFISEDELWGSIRTVLPVRGA